MPPTNRANRHASRYRTIIALLALPLLAACHPDALSSSSSAASSSASTPERPAEAQLITLDLQVPTAGWTLEPVAAYRLPDEIWIAHQLRAPEGMAAQVISTVSSTVELPARDLPIRHFVIGKTWNWDADSEVRFIASLQALQPELDGALPLPINPAR